MTQSKWEPMSVGEWVVDLLGASVSLAIVILITNQSWLLMVWGLLGITFWMVVREITKYRMRRLAREHDAKASSSLSIRPEA